MNRPIKLSQTTTAVIGIVLIRYLVETKNHITLSREYGVTKEHQRGAEELNREVREALQEFDGAIQEALKGTPDTCWGAISTDKDGKVPGAEKV